MVQAGCGKLSVWLFFPFLALDKIAPGWPEQFSSRGMRRKAGNIGEALPEFILKEEQR